MEFSGPPATPSATPVLNDCMLDKGNAGPNISEKKPEKMEGQNIYFLNIAFILELPGSWQLSGIKIILLSRILVCLQLNHLVQSKVPSAGFQKV